MRHGLGLRVLPLPDSYVFLGKHGVSVTGEVMSG